MQNAFGTASRLEIVESARAFGLLAVVALAIGIGSATAIYSVVQAVMLNPLPYANPERYFLLFGAYRPHSDLRTSSGFDDADKNPAATRGVVLSAGLWRRFGSEANIVGRPLTINGSQYVVTGVMPGWFQFPIHDLDSDLWGPLQPDERHRTDRGSHNLMCTAKLKAGATEQQATAELNRTLAGLQRAYPGPGEPDFDFLRPLFAWTVQFIRPSLVLLLASAVALLLITCANVASVLLARSVARARDGSPYGSGRHRLAAWNTIFRG